MQITVRDVDIHYTEHGAGVPVLAIHGFMADHKLMEGCMEPVFAALPGYRRIYLDLPVMGSTRSASWMKNSDDVLDVLLGFIDAVAPDQPFLLAGQSYGGYLAQAIVRRMPARVAGLMLLCPVVIPDRAQRTLPPHQVLKRYESLSQLMDDPSVSEQHKREFNDNVVMQTVQVWERMRQDVKPRLSIADARFLATLRNRGYALTNAGPAASFDKPVLIVAGRQDAVVGHADAWSLLAQYPRAGYAVLDGAGHYLQLERPALFEALATDWLRRAAAY